MIDVKKLIVGFLVLAVLGGSSALVLSSIGGRPTVAASATNVSGLASQSAQLSLPFGANAFVDPTTEAAASDTVASSTDPTNLTGAIASAFLNGIISANPQGPDPNATDSASFDAPDQTAMATALEGTPAVSDVQIPDWDIEVASQKINVATTSSTETVAQYSASLSDIFNKYFVNTNIQGMLGSSDADTSNVAYVQSQIAGALEQISGVQTPAPLVNFQKSLVKVLVYEKEVLALTANSNDDPAKASLILQAEQTKYQSAADDFTKQFQAAQSLQAFSFAAVPGPGGNGTGILAMVRNIIGIPTAHAQWVVFDPSSLAEMIWEFAQNIALQILKNTLINQLQNKVLSWVQGNGTPRFVQQWGRAFANVFISTTNSTIQHITPNLSPSYGSLVGLALQANGQLANSVQSTLDQNLSTLGTNPQNFYQNFNAGGMNAYLQVLQPDNNFYSAVMATHDAALAAGGTADQANQAKAISGQGFTGDEVCADGSDPTNGTHLVCLDQNDIPVYPNPNGTCDPGYFPAQEPNGGVCADGSEPQVTTPGQTTNQSLSSALGSPVHLIVNANNVVDLLVAMTNSLLSNLMNKAIVAGTSAINGGLNGTGSGSPPPTQPPAPIPVTCSTPVSTVTLTNAQAIAFFTVTGGATTNGLLPTYTWTLTGGTPATAAGSSVNVTYTLPGTYTATVTGSTGGTSSCTITVQ